MKVKMTVAALAALMGLVTSAASEADIAAFREARFGMFVHWGLYSQLGGRWKGVTMPHIGEWVQSYFRIPNDEYALLAKDFNPTKFDPDEWARQAKAAGMEYAILTTKHHDGFSMFATAVDDYNIIDKTPFKRDAFAEFAAACRRQGLRVGLYYSQAIDWHEFDGADPTGQKLTRRSSLANAGMPWGNSWDWPDASKKDISRYLRKKVYPQLKELLTNYGEIFVIWFDAPMCLTPEMSRDLREYVRSLQPHTLVNSRIGNGYGDFGSMDDNQMLTGKSKMAVESPATLNNTWGFKYDDHHWKSGYDIACWLMQAISCNANYLLNIGPRPDGRFPDASSDVLAELAAWRQKTGVRIRGAGPSPFAQSMPWGWCTTAPGELLQLVVRSDWTNGLEICGIRNGIRGCSCPFEKTGETVKLALPPVKDSMPRVVRIELEGRPDVDQRIMPQCGELILQPVASVRLEQGKGSEREVVIAEEEKKLIGDTCRITEQGAFSDWHHEGDMIVWKTYFPEPGRYRVWLQTETWSRSAKWAGEGRSVDVRIGDSHVFGALKKDRLLPKTVFERVESGLGTIAVPAVGEYEISVRTLAVGENAHHCDLTAVRLERE